MRPAVRRSARPAREPGRCRREDRRDRDHPPPHPARRGCPARNPDRPGRGSNAPETIPNPCPPPSRPAPSPGTWPSRIGRDRGGPTGSRGEGAMTHTSWRNRKTLILSRSEMIGLLEPEEYVRCVETAFRRMGEGRVFMEPKGHIVLDKYPGEWEIMPSYIEEPEAAPAAAACKWVSIRFENRAKIQPPHRVLDPDLYRARNRLPARHRGRHPSHTHADRRVRCRFRAMDGAQGVLRSCTGRCRRREHRRIPHLRGDARLEGGAGLEPDSGDAGCVHGERTAAPPRHGDQAVDRS